MPGTRSCTSSTCRSAESNSGPARSGPRLRASSTSRSCRWRGAGLARPSSERVVVCLERIGSIRPATTAGDCLPEIGFPVRRSSKNKPLLLSFPSASRAPWMLRGAICCKGARAMGEDSRQAAAAARGPGKPVAADVDPLTLSTVWHSLQRICREMRRVIERTAQSYLISQLKDISVGIWDGEGNTVAIPVGLPAQFVGAKYSVRYIMNEYGEDIYPGDVFLANDPYHGYSCHPPDWGYFRPVFQGDRLVFWTLARAHVEDTGAAFPGAYFSDPYDIHSEGLLVPGVRVIEKGREQRDIMRLIFNNVRLADGARTDSAAMIGATKLAENRLHDLIAKYGMRTVSDCLAVMQGRTERAVHACIDGMPDGTYHGESSTDDDGVEFDVPVTVRCEITVKGDRMAIDFSKSDGQRKGFVNCSYPTTYSLAMAGAILFLDSELVEFHNEGTMQCIDIIAPAGLVVNANYPSAMGGAPISMGHAILESVMMAMSAAVPARAAAGWGRRYGQYIYGINPRTNGLYVFPGYHAEGGAGAVAGYDGYQGSASIGTLGEI